VDTSCWNGGLEYAALCIRSCNPEEDASSMLKGHQQGWPLPFDINSIEDTCNDVAPMDYIYGSGFTMFTQSGERIVHYTIQQLYASN